MKQSVKIMTFFALFIVMLVNTSCSSKKSSGDVEEVSAGIEVDDSSISDEAMAGDESDLSNDSDEMAQSNGGTPMIDQGQATDASASSQLRGYQGEFGQYEVRKGDTLMVVAYMVYGDYKKWRDLAELNEIEETEQVVPGKILRYRQAWEKLPMRSNGAPYMIQSGDTLGTISNKHYGTTQKWKEVWNNNRQLITDPNLIFAGFTIYIMPQGEMAYISNSQVGNQMINLN